MGANSNQFSVRLNPALVEAITEFRELQEENGEILNTDKKVLESLVDVALSKFRPYKENKDQIDKLEKEKKELENNLSKTQEIAQQQEEYIKTLKDKIHELEQNSGKLKSLESDVIIKKSDIHPVLLALIRRYLKDKKTINIFSKENKAGKYDGFFSRIDVTPEEKAIANLLLTTFLRASMGKTLPAVVRNSKIIEKINEAKQGVF